MPEETTLRLAIVQTAMRHDPTSTAELRAGGAEIRDFLRQAAAAGARLVHFTEGAICFPSKRVMSELGPDEVGPSDWTRAQWPVLQSELDQIAGLAAELGIWAVIPSVHQLPEGRPHNSMYVVSDQGKVVTRYNERTLSTTKLTWMYTPGTEPVTFDVDGFRFGLALGLDVLFPELFTEYDQLGADGVLVSYATNRVSRHEHVAVQARGCAVNNTCWISFAVPANPDGGLASGVVDPRGEWVAQAPANGSPAIAVAEVHHSDVTQAGREFRRRTRERVGS
ncbi:carbon-nitrogen hydrolase family protein [Kribbella capetownensis]|uniref:Carbon-nitrogen hydrolase family protein n=2 Tax=Kribbella capetownensis TaxID=1572659 RepID=A0A4R0K275_9ACTN|nr:carbon-nitrogen hydrolase family protein [Kribbella capetownensis]